MQNRVEVLHIPLGRKVFTTTYAVIGTQASWTMKECLYIGKIIRLHVNQVTENGLSYIIRISFRINTIQSEPHKNIDQVSIIMIYPIQSKKLKKVPHRIRVPLISLL